jgi:spermidine synthase
VPLLVVLFAASGCAALIYEIVWLQLLELVIGSTAVSMAVLLAAYMGGMCAGSLLLARLVEPRRHPLRVFAAIELGIAACGLAVLYGVPAVRGAAGVMFLFVPTLLMGASLPAIARWVDVSRLGFLYGANIAGGVAGCLLAGFYLLRVHDMAVATYAAAGLNVAVALITWRLSRRPYTAVPDVPAEPAAFRAVYSVAALSGMTALGAEVIWTRLLSLMLGATVYTFSIILAVFLIGLGLGAWAAAWMARRGTARAALGWSQLALSAAILWAAFLIARWFPYWKVNPSWRYAIDFARCALALLPAACLWGAGFPLALVAAAGRGQDPARVAGRVYAANTAGAIAGAVAFSLWLVPLIGSQSSQRVLIALTAAAGLFALASPRALVAALLAWFVPAVPWQVIAWGRQLPAKTMPGDLLYLGEGRNASIAITELYKTRMFHISGKVEASNESQDMRVERMLGHIPALLHPRPRSALVVGCGAGVTAGSLVVHPEIERITICELEPLIPPAIARYFAKENHNVIRDPRTRMVFDDARHYVLTTPDRFDIITSDPIHPWVKGSATLYTREYFEMCKRRLNPGGVVVQWVPLYESDAETVKSGIATFFEAFPDGVIWSNDTAFEEGYDVVLFGQVGPLRIDLEELQRRLDRPDYAVVKQSLREVGFHSAIGLVATYAGRGVDMRPWLAGAQINRDRNLRLQFLAGLHPDLQGGYFIYDEMLRYRRYPEGLFVASAGTEAALRKTLRPFTGGQ